jgi:hypothetical protein
MGPRRLVAAMRNSQITTLLSKTGLTRAFRAVITEALLSDEARETGINHTDWKGSRGQQDVDCLLSCNIFLALL